MLIAGPTASGKSALALELAQTTGGVVINTDSMQVYRDLRIITARPTPEEEARVPHRLYGHVDAAVNFSAGAWVADAAKVLAEVRAENRLPIFVGGSGLYFKALTRGLSAVPPIPAEVRDAVRARLERDGVEALHAELARRDPASAERLKPRDRTRIARALEVVEATGRSLTDWHREGLPPLLPPERILRAVPRAGARSALRADRCAVRRDAGRGCAGGGRGAGRAETRSPAAGDEGPWRAGADPPLAAARSRAIRRPKSAAPTPATMPSGNSPGSGINCRNSNGWRRRRRGGGWAESFRGARETSEPRNLEIAHGAIAPLRSGRFGPSRNDGWFWRRMPARIKIPLAERPEPR